MTGRLALLLLCTVGCAPGCSPEPPSPERATFGQFEGDVVAVWDTDGRHMTLREDFAYIDAMGRRWDAPANSVINGASIPQGFWTFIGGPFEGRYRNASVVHDVACHRMQESWEEVHRMFYDACLCGGVDEVQAKTMYYAVYHFGPRWKTVTETHLEKRATESGEVVEEPVSVQVLVRNDPVPPTLDEIEQVTDFIAEAKPDAALIRQTSRDTLHRRKRRHHRSAHRTPHGSPHYRTPPGIAWPEGAEGQVPQTAPGAVAAHGQHNHIHEHSADHRQQTPSISPEEREWVTSLVRAHLEQQAGQQVPADYRVLPTAHGYRVFVQYLQFDEHGQAFTYPGGHCVFRLTREGRIREVRCGA